MSALPSYILHSLNTDALHEIRCSFVRLGKLPPLEKDQICYVDFMDVWRACTVTRKLAGSVYLAKLHTPTHGVKTVVISVGVFGGVLP